MASKKASAGARAAQFLAQIGTAGGPIGSPGLVTFGAGDVGQQVMSGHIDEYAAIRARGLAPEVGGPNVPQPRMPQDLDAAYLKLNLPGSPLPRNGLLAPQFLDAAEYAQDQIVMNEQRMLMPFMPPTGQLPMGIQPPMPRKKGSR
jgi:hypothetical protein